MKLWTKKPWCAARPLPALLLLRFPLKSTIKYEHIPFAVSSGLPPSEEGCISSQGRGVSREALPSVYLKVQSSLPLNTTNVEMREQAGSTCGSRRLCL